MFQFDGLGCPSLLSQCDRREFFTHGSLLTKLPCATAMTSLNFDDRQIRSLNRQCLHHNIFPTDIGFGLVHQPRPVATVLEPIVHSCISQLREMTFGETQRVIQSLPPTFRMFLADITEPLHDATLERIATYCIAAKLGEASSRISDIFRKTLDTSEVLAECPELRSRIDCDGLLTMDDDFLMLDGGIRYGDYLLHYHQFLRRGFLSNPNFDFLGLLSRYKASTEGVNRFRIAIDHRRIMKYADYREFVEMDTWYGPRFDRDKVDDPNCLGLTVVGRVYPNPLDSYPLERTEFFWRIDKGKKIKTIEIEEISSESKDGWFINRYLHAERDVIEKVFRHLDGAAKVYETVDHVIRVTQQMPRNTKAGKYQKLFRIDGAIYLEDWLNLVSMFYKGNEMVVEYFDPDLFNSEIRPRREEIDNALS